MMEASVCDMRHSTNATWATMYHFLPNQRRKAVANSTRCWNLWFPGSRAIESHMKVAVEHAWDTTRWA